MIADRIKAADRFKLFNDFHSNSRFMSATFPATIGQDKEVPKLIVYSSLLLASTEGTNFNPMCIYIRLDKIKREGK